MNSKKLAASALAALIAGWPGGQVSQAVAALAKAAPVRSGALTAGQVKTNSPLRPAGMPLGRIGSLSPMSASVSAPALPHASPARAGAQSAAPLALPQAAAAPISVSIAGPILTQDAHGDFAMSRMILETSAAWLRKSPSGTEGILRRTFENSAAPARIDSEVEGALPSARVSGLSPAPAQAMTRKAVLAARLGEKAKDSAGARLAKKNDGFVAAMFILFMLAIPIIAVGGIPFRIGIPSIVGVTALMHYISWRMKKKIEKHIAELKIEGPEYKEAVLAAGAACEDAARRLMAAYAAQADADTVATLEIRYEDAEEDWLVAEWRLKDLIENAEHRIDKARAMLSAGLANRLSEEANTVTDGLQVGDLSERIRRVRDEVEALGERRIAGRLAGLTIRLTAKEGEQRPAQSGEQAKDQGGSKLLRGHPLPRSFWAAWSVGFGLAAIFLPSAVERVIALGLTGLGLTLASAKTQVQAHWGSAATITVTTMIGFLSGTLASPLFLIGGMGLAGFLAFRALELQREEAWQDLQARIAPTQEEEALDKSSAEDTAMKARLDRVAREAAAKHAPGIKRLKFLFWASALAGMGLLLATLVQFAVAGEISFLLFGLGIGLGGVATRVMMALSRRTMAPAIAVLKTIVDESKNGPIAGAPPAQSGEQAKDATGGKLSKSALTNIALMLLAFQAVLAVALSNLKSPLLLIPMGAVVGALIWTYWKIRNYTWQASRARFETQLAPWQRGRIKP